MFAAVSVVEGGLTMTRSELNEIKDAIKQAHIEVEEKNNEVWLSTNDFLKQFQMFSRDWLEHFGWKLPRERAEVIDDDGKTRVTRWAYPRNMIQQMIRDHKLVNL